MHQEKKIKVEKERRQGGWRLSKEKVIKTNLKNSQKQIQLLKKLT